MHTSDSVILRDESDLGRLYDTLEAELNHGEVYVKFEPYVPKRSNLQNDLWWAYMTDIGKQIGATKEQAAVIVKGGIGLVEYIDFFGRKIPLAKSTTKMDKKEMSEAIREAEIWAAEIGLTLYAPDYRNEAMR